MGVELMRWDAVWGEPTEARLRRRLEAEGYTVSRYLYPPGTVFDDHTHSMDKKDAVVRGRLKIVVSGREFLLGPGDVIEIPAGTLHNAAVVGGEAVISLDATRAPAPGAR